MATFPLSSQDNLNPVRQRRKQWLTDDLPVRYVTVAHGTQNAIMRWYKNAVE
ncbi:MULTISPECIES: hypothetical protein [Pseudomonas syringae group]|uniref:hypothetical protein n=1 Tax=Pseudomonas syringae group TaxID=136849 RepID=UPI000A9DFA49|nr:MULTISPECIES: hypothetical protein [Pseudomonas syringae group]UNB63978.1 hypothetical protein MME54_04005 [Pseudomonas syringae pv. helianthi]